MSHPILPAMLSCSGTSLTDTEKKFFARINPLGITLFGRNIENRGQIKALTDEIKDVIGREDVLIAVDQEGGRVRRLQGSEFRNYAAAIDIGALPPEQALRAAELHATLIAEDLRDTGINVNYAPVLDILYPQTSPALKSRCFSADETFAAALGRHEVDAYIQGAIIPCIKHMPGHGRTDVDPHLGLPRLNQTLKDLEKDFYPFRQLNDCPLAMTAHIVLTAVDDTAPVTCSAAAIQEIIRNKIGFRGLLISDAIDMRALRGSAGEKAAAALAAGCDVICYALGDMAEMEDIARRCPPMSDKSLERFAAASKVIHNVPQQLPTQNLNAEYQTLVKSISAYEETYDATEVLNRLLKAKLNKGGKQC